MNFDTGDSNLVTSSTFVASIILAYLANVSLSFGSMTKEEQGIAKTSLRKRANFAFIGFLLAVISVVAALMVLILGNACFVISAASLAVVLLGSLWMAWAMVQEIV